MQTDIDWTEFTASIYLDADPGAVYRAWVTAEGLRHWFPAEARFSTSSGQTRPPGEVAQAGDAYGFAWFGGHLGKGVVLEARSALVRMTFGDPVIVSVSIAADGDQTHVVVTHSNIPDTPAARVNIYLKCRLSWCFYLNNLKAYLEHAVDLRDRNAAHLQDPIADGNVSY